MQQGGNCRMPGVVDINSSVAYTYIHTCTHRLFAVVNTIIWRLIEVNALLISGRTNGIAMALIVRIMNLSMSLDG